MSGNRNNCEAFEEDDDLYGVGSVTSAIYGPGVALYALGWETAPDKETEWSGYEQRTGRVLCVMVGDDCYFSQDPDDLAPLDREEYCGECGQVGCQHDGYEREG